MDRLSGLDASFLYLETPAQLMHVCGLIILDPSTMPEPYSFAAMRDGIEGRVRDVPEFTRRLRRVPLGIDHPIWVRDKQFDIERHVHRLALPTPGGYAELAELSGHLAGLPLDRSRPLWEMWVIEGYDGDDGRELVAVFQKMHHATVDGVSGCQPDLPPVQPGAAAEPPMRAPPSRRRGRTSRAEPSCSAAALVTTRDPAVQRRSACWRPSASVVSKTIGRAREGTAMAAPLTAPRTSFNGTITSHRSIALADMDLDDIKEIKAATGTTVNDVVLAVAGGALRSYLEDRDELPSSSLLATVPVSVRSESKRSERRQQGLRAVHQARDRRRGPARAARGHGDRQPERQGAPQGDQRRLAAGLGRVRRAAHLRPRRPRVRRPAAAPRSTRWCTTWSSPTSPARRCRSTSWAP